VVGCRYVSFCPWCLGVAACSLFALFYVLSVHLGRLGNGLARWVVGSVVMPGLGVGHTALGLVVLLRGVG